MMASPVAGELGDPNECTWSAYLTLTTSPTRGKGTRAIPVNGIADGDYTRLLHTASYIPSTNHGHYLWLLCLASYIPSTNNHYTRLLYTVSIHVDYTRLLYTASYIPSMNGHYTRLLCTPSYIPSTNGHYTWLLCTASYIPSTNDHYTR